jgi:hypothetical protein
MKNSLMLLFLTFSTGQLLAQASDELTIRRIYDEALSKGKSYEMIESHHQSWTKVEWLFWSSRCSRMEPKCYGGIWF